MKTVNITFSKLIKIDNRQWEVNFRKLPGTPNQFHVDTATLQGERIQFNLERNESEWRLIGRDVPELIAGAREKLVTAVEKGMQEYYPQFTA